MNNQGLKRDKKRMEHKIIVSIKLITLLIFVLIISGCKTTQDNLVKAESFYNAGVVYMDRGEYDKALESLKSSRNLDPESSRTYNCCLL